MTNNTYFIYQWIIPFIVLFFFVFAIIGFAVGIGLVVNSARMFRFFELMNHWTSMRKSTRWAAIPRDISPTVNHYRRWIGGVFIVIGVVGLVSGYDLARIIAGLHVDVSRLLVSVVFQTLAWFVVVGNVFAVVVGAMLIFKPTAFESIRTRLDRWVSTRQMSAGGDSMRMALDKWIQAFPKRAGWIISGTALFVAVDFGFILFTRL